MREAANITQTLEIHNSRNLTPVKLSLDFPLIVGIILISWYAAVRRFCTFLYNV